MSSKDDAREVATSDEEIPEPAPGREPVDVDRPPVETSDEDDSGETVEIVASDETTADETTGGDEGSDIEAHLDLLFSGSGNDEAEEPAPATEQPASVAPEPTRPTPATRVVEMVGSTETIRRVEETLGSTAVETTIVARPVVQSLNQVESLMESVQAAPAKAPADEGQVARLAPPAPAQQAVAPETDVVILDEPVTPPAAEAPRVDLPHPVETTGSTSTPRWIPLAGLAGLALLLIAGGVLLLGRLERNEIAAAPAETTRSFGATAPSAGGPIGRDADLVREDWTPTPADAASTPDAVDAGLTNQPELDTSGPQTEPPAPRYTGRSTAETTPSARSAQPARTPPVAAAKPPVKSAPAPSKPTKPAAAVPVVETVTPKTAPVPEPRAVVEPVEKPTPATVQQPVVTEVPAPVERPAAPVEQPAPPVEPVFQAPELIERIEPQVPDKVLRRSGGGTVVLSILVSEHGGITRVIVDKGAASPELESAAISAVLRWRYRPATNDGTVVQAWTTERFVFRP